MAAEWSARKADQFLRLAKANFCFPICYPIESGLSRGNGAAFVGMAAVAESIITAIKMLAVVFKDEIQNQTDKEVCTLGHYT